MLRLPLQTEENAPVYQCLRVKTCGGLSNGNYMMEEDRVMKTDHEAMKAAEDDV